MRVSVVITTSGLASAVESVLSALQRQSYPQFEVLLVKVGFASPLALPPHIADFVRVFDAPTGNLGAARNLGLRAAAGEFVAFLCDTASPDPHWLRELAAGYDHPKVVGVGGPAVDPLGRPLGDSWHVRSRHGRQIPSPLAPWDVYQLPGGEFFVRFWCDNGSYRRSALLRVGGFDEELSSEASVTDLCARLIENGGRLRLVQSARVYGLVPPDESLSQPTCPRDSRIDACHKECFRPFPRLQPVGGTRVLAFVGDELPTVAREWATAGHEVYWFTEATDKPCIRYSDGVWTHQLPAGQVFAEISRISRERPWDVFWVVGNTAAGQECLRDEGLAATVWPASGGRLVPSRGLSCQPGLRVSLVVMSLVPDAPHANVIRRLLMALQCGPGWPNLRIYTPRIAEPNGRALQVRSVHEITQDSHFQTTDLLIVIHEPNSHVADVALVAPRGTRLIVVVPGSRLAVAHPAELARLIAADRVLINHNSLHNDLDSLGISAENRVEVPVDAPAGLLWKALAEGVRANDPGRAASLARLRQALLSPPSDPQPEIASSEPSKPVHRSRWPQLRQWGEALLASWFLRPFTRP